MSQLTDQMSPTEAVFYFLKGLRPACKQHVYLHEVSTLEEAMQIALDFENSAMSGNNMDLNVFSGRRQFSFRNRRPFGQNQRTQQNFRRPAYNRIPPPQRQFRSFNNFSRTSFRQSWNNRQSRPNTFENRNRTPQGVPNRRSPNYQQNRSTPNYARPQRGGPQFGNRQNFRPNYSKWRPAQSLHTFHEVPHQLVESDSYDTPYLNYSGAQASGPSL